MCSIVFCNNNESKLVTICDNKGHEIHSECLYEYLMVAGDSNLSCPMCRNDNLNEIKKIFDRFHTTTRHDDYDETSEDCSTTTIDWFIKPGRGV